MYIVIAMNHKYLGHLTFATCRSFDPLAMDVSCIHQLSSDEI
jgi:hypothetical protein